MSPAEVAEMVLQAVKENEFYVVTNRSVDEQIRERMEAILNRRDLSVYHAGA
jgi:adenosyl cobinamide kinase/adenosyl cobinamide phosphate guanylyltransferase